MNNKKMVVLMLTAALIFAMTGCDKSSSDSAGTAQESSSVSESSGQSSDSLDTIFALYNKVVLEQTKDQVDAEMGITGEENSNAPNTYYYADPATGYGVSVLYDRGNIAIGKTVIYNSHEDIAPFCNKPVSKEQIDQITDSMTYDQVKEVLGGAGIEVSISELGAGSGEQSVIKRWANGDGSCLDVYFGPDGSVNNSNYFDNNY